MTAVESVADWAATMDASSVVLMEASMAAKNEVYINVRVIHKKH